MSKKLIKVTFEYSDGSVECLDHDAEKWLNELNGLCVLGHMHGIAFSIFNWKKLDKKD